MSHKLEKMLQKLKIFPFLLVAVYGSGEFSVLQSPSSLEWKGDDVLMTESIRDVISASVGVWTNSNSEWGGLYIRDPLSTPKSALAIFVDGIEKLDISPKPLVSFQTEGDSDTIFADFDTWNAQKTSDDIVNIDLEEVNEHSEAFTQIFNEIEVQEKAPANLKPELHSEDKHFLTQISYFDALAKKIKAEKSLPKSLFVRISISGLITAHGENSAAVEDIKKILSNTIENMSEAFNQAGANDVLITLIAHRSDGKSRSKRDVPVNIKELKIAQHYSENYPAIFNIILWFMVAFGLALVAICYVIGDMDPGRDSIIYRMTSTRMKKDN